MINSVKERERERESSDSLAILVSNPWIRQKVEYKPCQSDSFQ